MALLGIQSAIRVDGTAVPAVGLATTLVASSGGLAFQITDPTKRVLDPSVAVAVRANAIAQGRATFTIDPLFGVITFAAPPTAPVVIDASYLPTLALVEVTSGSINMTRELLDNTTASLTSDLARKKQPGLKDATASVQLRGGLLEDIDPDGVAVRTLVERFDIGAPFLLEVQFADGYGFRGWMVYESQGEDVTFDALVERALSCSATLVDLNGGTEEAAFGFGLLT